LFIGCPFNWRDAKAFVFDYRVTTAT